MTSPITVSIAIQRKVRRPKPVLIYGTSFMGALVPDDLSCNSLPTRGGVHS